MTEDPRTCGLGYFEDGGARESMTGNSQVPVLLAPSGCQGEGMVAVIISYSFLIRVFSIQLIVCFLVGVATEMLPSGSDSGTFLQP